MIKTLLIAGAFKFIYKSVWLLKYGEIFYSLKEAQILIERWRQHYNTKRPHSSLNGKPPVPVKRPDPKLGVGKMDVGAGHRSKRH